MEGGSHVKQLLVLRMFVAGVLRDVWRATRFGTSTRPERVSPPARPLVSCPSSLTAIFFRQFYTVVKLESISFAIEFRVLSGRFTGGTTMLHGIFM